jgi:hypothetical protein
MTCCRYFCPNNRFQRIETADSFRQFCGKLKVLYSNQVYPMRFQPLKHALNETASRRRREVNVL